MTPEEIARDRAELAEAAFRMGFVQGATEEHASARDEVGLVLRAQPKASREMLVAALGVLRISDLAIEDSGPAMSDEEAQAAWAALRANTGALTAVQPGGKA